MAMSKWKTIIHPRSPLTLYLNSDENVSCILYCMRKTEDMLDRKGRCEVNIIFKKETYKSLNSAFYEMLKYTHKKITKNPWKNLIFKDRTGTDRPIELLRTLDDIEVLVDSNMGNGVRTRSHTKEILTIQGIREMNSKIEYLVKLAEMEHKWVNDVDFENTVPETSKRGLLVGDFAHRIKTRYVERSGQNNIESISGVRSDDIPWKLYKNRIKDWKTIEEYNMKEIVGLHQFMRKISNMTMELSGPSYPIISSTNKGEDNERRWFSDEIDMLNKSGNKRLATLLTNYVYS